MQGIHLPSLYFNWIVFAKQFERHAGQSCFQSEAPTSGSSSPRCDHIRHPVTPKLGEVISKDVMATLEPVNSHPRILIQFVLKNVCFLETSKPYLFQFLILRYKIPSREERMMKKKKKKRGVTLYPLEWTESNGPSMKP